MSWGVRASLEDGICSIFKSMVSACQQPGTHYTQEIEKTVANYTILLPQETGGDGAVNASPISAVAGEEGPLAFGALLMLGLLAVGSRKGEFTTQEGKIQLGGEVQLPPAGGEGRVEVCSHHQAILGAAGGQGEGGSATFHPQRLGEGQAEGSAVLQGLTGLEAEGAAGEAGDVADELATGHRWGDHAQFPLGGELPSLGCGGGQFRAQEEGVAGELAEGAAALAAQ